MLIVLDGAFISARLSVGVRGARVEGLPLQQVLTFPLPGTQGTTNPNVFSVVRHCILHKCIFIYHTHGISAEIKA